jgi:hypothetical protein
MVVQLCPTKLYVPFFILITKECSLPVCQLISGGKKAPCCGAYMLFLFFINIFTARKKQSVRTLLFA